MSSSPSAIVLLSGGLDSATVLAMALDKGYHPIALSFDYGQRHLNELDAARMLAQDAGLDRHEIVKIDLRAFGGSALTDDIDVPKDRTDESIGDGIPITYVPARNTIFLSFALALAEVTESFDIFVGVNALDYSGYPDCRPAYLKAMQNVMNLATKAGVEGVSPITLHAPLIAMSKADIVTTGTALGVDYGKTMSCYDPTEDGAHCGACDACLLRRKGFYEAAIPDPTRYKAG